MTDARKRLLAGCLGSALALALLAWAAFHADGFRHLDARLLAHLSAGRFGWVGDLADPVADLGNPLPQVLLLITGLALALHEGRRQAAAAGFAIVAGANLTTLLLKHALAAQRLDPVLGWAQVEGDAFPSGHTTAAFAMAAAWALFVPRRWRWQVALGGSVLASLVVLSVVVLRHHFPSDVLGGILVVSIWTCGVLALPMESLSSGWDTSRDSGHPTEN